MIDSASIVPPIIQQYYNRMLLCTPTLKFGDACHTFEFMWKQALKLWYKLDANPKRKERCERLKQEILEIYERAKIKEKERESQKDHKTQEFGYFVALPKVLDRDVHARLRFGRKAGAFTTQFRSNYEV